MGHAPIVRHIVIIGLRHIGLTDLGGQVAAATGLAHIPMRRHAIGYRKKFKPANPEKGDRSLFHYQVAQQVLRLSPGQGNVWNDYPGTGEQTGQFVHLLARYQHSLSVVAVVATHSLADYLTVVKAQQTRPDAIKWQDNTPARLAAAYEKFHHILPPCLNYVPAGRLLLLNATDSPATLQAHIVRHHLAHC